MKLLFDECLPKRLKYDFPGHEAFTVDEVAFKGLENGDLLQAASGRFDVFITVDRRLTREHDVSLFDIGVIVLISQSNRYEDLKPLLLKILNKLGSISSGQVIEISR
jgi:predicted nuclease of predicted toxin-antitoxin system